MEDCSSAGFEVVRRKDDVAGLGGGDDSTAGVSAASSELLVHLFLNQLGLLLAPNRFVLPETKKHKLRGEQRLYEPSKHEQHTNSTVNSALFVCMAFLYR
jgi:hypothetical protein